MTTRRDIVLGSAAIAATSLRTAFAQSAAGSPPQGSDWRPAPPDSQGLSNGALERLLYDGAAVRGLRGLLVARHGVLVGERYFDRAGPDDLQPIHSCTKSLCSLLVGQALQRGSLPGLEATVRQLLPQAAARAPESAASHASLRQILTGRSGIAYERTRQARELAEAADPVRYALDLPADPQGSSRWTYNDAAVSLLSPILAQAEGQDLADLARRDLFAPLGIERFGWQRDRSDLPRAQGGVSLRPRDLLKLAWMTLDGGRWNGRAVVPAAWAAEILVPRGPASWRAAPVDDVGYGCLWFTGRLHGEAVAWAWGYGAQFALLAPRLRLAVVTVADAPPPSALPQRNDAVMGLVARVVQLAAAGKGVS